MDITKLKFEVTGTAVYALEFDRWSKGQEQMRNRVYAHVQGYRDTPKEEQEAVAKLFAASPEMLQALKDVVKWCSDEKFFRGGLTELQAKTLFQGIIKEINPVIVKAEG